MSNLTARKSGVYVIHHHPKAFSRRSGFPGLIEQLDAEEIRYDLVWQKLQARSWSLGQALRKLGIAYSGSTWYGPIPLWDEMRFARSIRPPGPNIAHFIWGEFSMPRHPSLFRRRGARLVGTFHATVRSQQKVLGGVRDFSALDWITVVSSPQIAYFVERGFPAERIRMIPMGVDTEHFTPPAVFQEKPGVPLRCLLVGMTERDNAFAAQVFSAIPDGVAHLSVRTSKEQEIHYDGARNVTLLPYQSDEALLELYRSSDLVIMPMLDCTSNDALLEMMCCGTPVLTNRVGGIPEYVSSEICWVTPEKNVGAWRALIQDLSINRRRLWERRPAVRRWAERFGWDVVAKQYRQLYDTAIARP